MRLLFTSPQNSSFLITDYSALYLLGILDSVQALTKEQVKDALGAVLVQWITDASAAAAFTDAENHCPVNPVNPAFPC
jgi:hypothetical protein